MIAVPGTEFRVVAINKAGSSKTVFVSRPAHRNDQIGCRGRIKRNVMQGEGPFNGCTREEHASEGLCLQEMRQLSELNRIMIASIEENRPTIPNDHHCTLGGARRGELVESPKPGSV